MTMNKNALRFGAFCAPIAFICIGVGWAGFAGLMPPPPPSAGPEEIAQRLADRHFGILFGCVVGAIGAGGFFLMFVATMSALMTRMERGLPIYTFTNMVTGLFTGLVTMTSSYVWIVAAFRPDRDPVAVQALNDFAWLFVLSPFSFGVIQFCVIGMAILNDKSAVPLFPRWVAYLNFWVAFLSVPAGLIPFFMSGPFAWNGIIAFWLVLFAFAGWTIAMPWAMFRAIKLLPDEA